MPEEYLASTNGLHGLHTPKTVSIDELGASCDERLRCFSLAKAEHDFARLTQPSREAGKIAITRDDAKAVYVGLTVGALVQEVHGIDDDGAVR